MRELDFDFFTTQDAGRTMYRGFFIYGGFVAYKQVYTQVSPSATRWCDFVENKLW